MAAKRKPKGYTAKFFDEKGEEAEAQLHLKLNPGRQLFNWIRIFEAGLTTLANKRFSGRAASLVFFILGHCDWKNYFIPDSALIWAVCGIPPKHQREVFRELLAEGVLLPDRVIGKTQCYRVHPCLGWKGYAKDYPRPAELELIDNQFVWAEIIDWRPAEIPLAATPQS